MYRIPYARPTITAEDIQAITAVMESGRLATGETVERYERAVCEYIGCRYAVAFANATCALHSAYIVADYRNTRWWQKALGLIGLYRPRVYTSPISFVATSNMLRKAGARIRFGDVDEYICLSPVEKENVVGVHFAGHPCIGSMGHAVADGAHALGSTWQGRKIGSGENDMTVFSTHAIKNITTLGEGGLVTTNDDYYDFELRLLRSHGRQGGKMITRGFNYRLTDAASACGISQLRRIDATKRRKDQIFARYVEVFRGLPIVTPKCHPLADPHWHLFFIRIDNRDRVQKYLADRGIQGQINYRPIYDEPYYRDLGYTDKLPKAEDYWHHALSIPFFSGMTDREAEEVARVVKEAVGG